MRHFASTRFWELYGALPASTRRIADKNYALLRENANHPSLHFKRIGFMWSVRVGSGYRALGHDVDNGIQWFWIGTHADYDRLVS